MAAGSRSRGAPAPGVATRDAAFRVLRASAGGTPWRQALRDGTVDLRARTRDRRLAHEIASGATRLASRLDAIAAALAARPLADLDRDVRLVLRVGLYQIFEMQGIAPHAAVHATVEVAKRRTPRAVRFVNAVLRAAGRGVPATAFPDPEREPAAYLATWGAHPAWLVERWLGRFGFEATRRLVERDNQRPALCLRVNRLRTTRDALLERLPGSLAGTWSPDAVRVGTARYAAVRLVVEAGLASVQDESAMLVAPLLAPEPGARLLDLAAAPGGKACHLGELLAGTGVVHAVDAGRHKLERVRRNAARLGLSNVVAVHADARAAGAEPAAGVLLDAPCTGLGVLARRPDLRWRKQRHDLERLPALQRELLTAAAAAVEPGGRLVYSVCSFEPEETVEIAAAFAAAQPGFEPDDAGMPATLRPGPGLRYFLPQEHGMDGGFVARWRRSNAG